MSDHQPWRLLQIDDDEDDFILTSSMLSRFQGRKVILEWASTFEAGHRQLVSNHYDAVLIDYDLGHHTGIELIREFVERGYPAPLILYTGRGSYEVDVEAMQAGATLYITKTEATPLLLERSIRYAIERKQIEAELRTTNERLIQELNERRRVEQTLEIANADAVNERNRLQAVMDTLPVGVAIANAQGGDIQANRGFEQVWGGPPPEAHTIRDYAVYKAWQPDTRQPLQPEEWASARAVKLGETVVGQFLEIERFDGSHAYVMNSAAPIRDAQGQITGSAVAIMDITALETTERRASMEREWFHTTLASIGDAVITADLQGKVTFLNPVAEKLTGWTNQEASGQRLESIFCIIDEYSRKPVENPATSVLRSNAVVSLANHSLLISRDGREIPIEDSAAPIRDSTGATQGVVMVFHDVADKRKAQRALQQSEALYRSIVSNLPNTGVCVFDRDLRCLAVDGKVLERLNLTPATMEGRTIGDVFPKDSVLLVEERCRRALAGETNGDETEYQGQALWTQYVPLRDENGQVEAALALLLDITERKRYEEARQAEREKLAYLASFPEQNPNPVVEVDPDGSVRYANPTALRLFPDLEELGAAHPWLADWPAFVQPFLKGEKDVITRDLTVGEHTYHQALYYFAQDGYIRIYSFDITERKQAGLALLRAKQEWEQTFDSVPDLIAILDDQYRIIRANAAMAERLGVTPDQTAGLPCFTCVHGTTYPPDLCPHTLTLRDGQQHVAEVHEDRLGGDFLVSTTPLHDEQGRVTGSVHVARDITELKRVEEALRQAKTDLELRVQERTAELEQANRTLEAEIGERRLAESALIAEQQRFNDVFDAMPVYLILLTADYHIAMDNRFFRERFGESRGRPCYEFLFNRSEPCETCETYNVLKTMAPLEWEWTGPDGRSYYIYDFPFTERDGSTLIMEVGIDITERKQAEAELEKHRCHLEELVKERTGQLEEINTLLVSEIADRQRVEAALRESEARLNRAQEIARLGSWELDLVADHLSWSDEVYRIFGLAPQEFDASYDAFLEGVHPDDREAVDAAYSGSLRDGQASYEIEHRIVRKSTGEVRTVRQKCEHVRDASGRIIRSVGMIHDITELKQAEQALQEHTAQLEVYADQLERSNQALQDFIFIASHDLREPLRKVQVFGDRLQSRYSQVIDSEGQDYVERMRQAAGRMQDMLDGLLVYSRITTQGRSFETVDLEQVAVEVLSDLEVRLTETDGRVELDSLPVIQADPLQMRQLLQNLIANALKFHRQDIPPQVKITGRISSADFVQVIIEDNGIGFEEKQVEWIFKPFHRLHGRSVYEGTGMGLAICRKIVEHHGGSISAASIPEAGSIFTVTLPKFQTQLKQPGSEA